MQEGETTETEDAATETEADTDELKACAIHTKQTKREAGKSSEFEWRNNETAEWCS